MIKSKGRNRFGGKILAAILAVPIFVFLAEIFLTLVPIDTYFENRFFIVNRSLDYPDIFQKDKALFWRFRPDRTITSRFFDGRTYHINRYGLRGEEIPPYSGKTRIVALGNSCTFGWGMTDDQTFARQLQRLLNEDRGGPTAEVINAGIPGYSTFQGNRFLVSDIIPLQPDILLVMFAWNDQWAAASNIPDNEQELPPQLMIDIQNYLARLKLYRLIKKLLLSAIEKPLDQVLDKKAPVYRVSQEDFRDNLKEMIGLARGAGIRPVLMTSPIPSLEKYYPPNAVSNMHKYHEYYNEQTRRVAAETGADLIDLAHIFDAYDNLFDDASRDPIHFNAAGHEMAAAAIYDYLKNHPDIYQSRK